MNLISQIQKFSKEVVQEFYKISYPTRYEVIHIGLVVLLSILGVSLIFFLVDLVMGTTVKFFIAFNN